MKTIPIIIDCDTGTDDAIAIIAALAHPRLALKGITTIGGNSDVANTTKNTLKVLELCQAYEVPVVAGRTAPLLNQLLKTGFGAECRTCARKLERHIEQT